MKSATKFYIDDDTVKKLFDKAGFKDAGNIRPLSAGEFNNAYCAASGGREYVLKLSPKSGADVLTYERSMMEMEVKFYDLIRRNSSVKVPEIYFYDASRSIVDAEYFIMEKLPGKPLAGLKLSGNERKRVYFEIGAIIANLHTIRGDKFGYIQNGLKDDWYSAIRSMTENLIADCERHGKKARRGYRLLNHIDKNKRILEQVESTYTHFDIWEGNVFYNKSGDKAELTVIDTERGFYGDRLGDFCSLMFNANLNAKGALIKGYNSVAAQSLTMSAEELIRFNILLAYLGLIAHVEKYIRYKRSQPRYYGSVFVSMAFMNLAFKRLRRYERNK